MLLVVFVYTFTLTKNPPNLLIIVEAIWETEGIINYGKNIRYC